MLSISSFSTREDALNAATRKISKVIATSRQPILFLSSGGSALSLLETLTLPQSAQNLTLSIVDERFSTQPTINNFAQLTQTQFFRRAKAAGAQWIDTRPDKKDSLSNLAKRFETALRQWRANHPNGIIIATFGIGEDGHTAGIFPYPEDPVTFHNLFQATAKWVTGYNAAGKHEHSERVTVTPDFITRQIDYTVIYAVGSKKIPTLRRFMASEGTWHETPARILREHKNSELFTDFSPEQNL